MVGNPRVFKILEKTPTETLVDVLNEHAQPGVAARLREGWATAWVNRPDVRNRRVELLGHALMHLINGPKDFEFLYPRLAQGKGRELVLRTLKSETIARLAASRLDALGILAILVMGLIVLIAALGSGPEYWAGDFWKAAAGQAGALIVAGLVVLIARPDHVTRQRRTGKQLVALADRLGWQLRRDVPHVAHAFPWKPFGAVIDLGASPIAEPETTSGEKLGGGAAFLHGDIGQWPRRRPFAARAVWVTGDAPLPRVDIVDRTMPAHVSRTIGLAPVTPEYVENAQRLRVRLIWLSGIAGSHDSSGHSPSKYHGRLLSKVRDLCGPCVTIEGGVGVAACFGDCL